MGLTIFWGCYIIIFKLKSHYGHTLFPIMMFVYVAARYACTYGMLKRNYRLEKAAEYVGMSTLIFG